MFHLFNIFSLFDLFRVPSGDYVSTTVLLELATADGVLLVTADGNYLGVRQ